MKTLTRWLAVLAVSVFFTTNYAQASIIAASTGTAQRTIPRVQFFYQLGSGLETDDLNYIYLTFQDSATGGYITDFQLWECDDNTYLNPSSNCQSGTSNGTGNLWKALTTVGGTTNYSVAFTGAGKRTVEIDFSIHSLPGCNPGVNCTGSNADIVLDPTKFYVLYFQFDTQVNGAGTDLSRYIYGISNTLTDTSGNPILCAFSLGDTTGCVDGTYPDFTDVHTPYYILADAAISTIEQPTWGFITPASSSTGLNLSGAEEVCEGIFDTASNSFGYRDFFKWACVLQGWLYIPSADAFDAFDAPIELAKEHLPFSYAYEVLTIYENASTASGSIPIVAVPYDMGQAWGQIASSSFVLFSIDTIKTYITDDILGTIRDLLSAVVWVWVVQTIWRRTRSIIGQ